MGINLEKRMRYKRKGEKGKDIKKFPYSGLEKRIDGIFGLKLIKWTNQ
jgi:hypothetical protein